MNQFLIYIILIAASLYLGATYHYYSPFYTQTKHASAVIHPTKGNTCNGTVTFTQTKNGLFIKGRVSGLPQGLHGFHVHEFGNCACDDAECAGGHFNPDNQPHGAQTAEKRHIGDFGNIEADADGIAEFEFEDTFATLNGPHSIIGRALIVHAQPDDYTSQPSGNAGARIGCGPIGIAKSQD